MIAGNLMRTFEWFGFAINSIPKHKWHIKRVRPHLVHSYPEYQQNQRTLDRHVPVASR
jgi:hypothetical protein